MLVDFTAWQRLGHSVTGARYEKWEHGHLPHELIMAEKDLKASDRISEEPVDYYGLKLKHITASEGEKRPNLASFNEDEIAIVEGVLRRYGHESASYLRQLSHQTIGWQLARDREDIPYSTALLPDGPPPDSLVQEFRALYGVAN